MFNCAIWINVFLNVSRVWLLLLLSFLLFFFIQITDLNRPCLLSGWRYRLYWTFLLWRCTHHDSLIEKYLFLLEILKYIFLIVIVTKLVVGRVFVDEYVLLVDGELFSIYKSPFCTMGSPSHIRIFIILFSIVFFLFT